MPLQVHVANIGLQQVDTNGVVFSKQSADMKRVISASTEQRIIPNADLINTSQSPTLKSYLELEAADGFSLKHLDQTFVITEKAT
jgi:hypothetical protein